MKLSKNQWIAIATPIVALIGIGIAYISSSPQQKIINSPNSINTANQSGGINTLIVATAQISEEQKRVILSALGPQPYSVQILHTSGASNVIAKQLADIFTKAGWHVIYNPYALSAGTLQAGKIEIAVSANKPTIQAITTHNALKAADLSFPVGFISGNDGDILVGDF